MLPNFGIKGLQEYGEEPFGYKGANLIFNFLFITPCTNNACVWSVAVILCHEFLSVEQLNDRTGILGIERVRKTLSLLSD